MNSNKSEQNNKLNSKELDLQDTTDNMKIKENVSAKEDGFRYDYNDSSDFK